MTSVVAEPEELSAKRTLPPWVGPAAILLLLGIALVVLHGELRQYQKEVGRNGGHHFDDDFKALGDIVIDALDSGR